MKTIVVAVAVVATLTAIVAAGCGGLSDTDKQALDLAARSNLFAAKYADGGLSSVFNRAAYCGIRGIELRNKVTPPDAGLVCPQ